MSEDTAEVLPSDHAVFAPARALLHRWTLSNLCNSMPPKTVLTLAGTATCAQALRLLATHQVSSAPVFDGRSYMGFIDVMDILNALLHIVNVRELTDENKEFKLRAAGLQLEHQQLRSLNPAQDGALIYRADMTSTLHEVVLYGFLQPNAAGHMHVVHRVGVFDTTDDTSDDDVTTTAASGVRNIRIIHVVSQIDILTFLQKHVDELGPLADVTLQQLGLASKPVVCVPAEMSTINAFASMVANNVSCVGVVSHSQGGGLAASLSSSDLSGLLPEQFAAALLMPVLQYLQAKSSAAWGAQQTLRLQEQQQQHHQQQPNKPQLLPQLQQQQQPGLQVLQQQRQEQACPAGSAHMWGLKSAEGLKPPELVCVGPNSSLREVLELLAQHRLHRLHVIDEAQRPVGIVTITDLLRVIVGCSELLEALGPDLEQLEQEVDQMAAEGLMDVDCGMDAGEALIEGSRRGILAVSSQALLST